MRRAAILPLFLLGIAAVGLLFSQSTPSGVLSLTATTANVAGAPDAVRFEILRWSTDDEREKLMSAWELKFLPGDGAGKPARGGGRGAAAAGRGRAAPSAPTTKLTPEAALANALQETTTVGYLWSSENVGYALRYAARIANPDRSQRIILITDRRLGAVNQLWNPTFSGDPNTYEFSVIELRLNAKDEGEGRASITGKIAPDPAAKIVTLENYDMLPAIFKDVRSKKP